MSISQDLDFVDLERFVRRLVGELELRLVLDTSLGGDAFVVAPVNAFGFQIDLEIEVQIKDAGGIRDRLLGWLRN